MHFEDSDDCVRLQSEIRLLVLLDESPVQMMIVLYCALVGSWVRCWGRDVLFDMPQSLRRDRRGQC